MKTRIWDLLLLLRNNLLYEYSTTKCEFALFYRRDVAIRYYEFAFRSAFIISTDTSRACEYIKCCYFKVKALQWNSSTNNVLSYKDNSLVFYEQ